jgi:hypothetical protein
MMQIVQTLMRFMPHVGAEGDALDRSERDRSYDEALAAFKADLAERAEKNTRHIPGEWQSRRT